MTQGPNVKRLIAAKMAAIAIPPGGGFADGLKFLQSADRIKAAAREATDFVTAAIAAVKSSPDNPYRTDEEIAGAILAKIEERKRSS